MADDEKVLENGIWLSLGAAAALFAVSKVTPGASLPGFGGSRSRSRSRSSSWPPAGWTPPKKKAGKAKKKRKPAKKRR